MDIRFLIEQLDEITRRGFLTGLAATGAAGYYGKQALDKSKAEKKEKSARLRQSIYINIGDTKSKVYKLLGKPDKEKTYDFLGGYSKWVYNSPYPLDFDITEIYFGNGYNWKNLDGRVVGKSSNQMIDTYMSDRQKNQEFDDEEARIKQQARDIAKKFSPALGAGPDDWKLEETSDEAIARIVELSKDKK